MTSEAPPSSGIPDSKRTIFFSLRTRRFMREVISTCPLESTANVVSGLDPSPGAPFPLLLVPSYSHPPSPSFLSKEDV